MILKLEFILKWMHNLFLQDLKQTIKVVTIINIKQFIKIM